jgi:hypothetical protein
LLIFSFISLFSFALIEKKYGLFLSFIPFLALIPHVIYVLKCTAPQELDSELKKVALVTFAVSVFTGLGLWLI